MLLTGASVAACGRVAAVRPEADGSVVEMPDGSEHPDGGAGAAETNAVGEDGAVEDAGAADAGHGAGGALDAGRAIDAGSSTQARPADAGSGPPYPIVLAHGFSGWSSIGPIEYFYEVPEALRADGHDVHVAQVDPYADSFTRGAELLEFVQRVLAQTGAAKVDIIAHSQGGLDARYVAHALPSGVAAIAMLATPNHGTAVADDALEGMGGSDGPAQQILDFLFDVAGTTPPGLGAATWQLSSAGAAEFNAKIPDAPGVAYFSMAGRSNLQHARAACQAAEPAFISRWDPYVDPVRPSLLAGAILLAGDPFDPTPNDGLVAVESTRWGTFLGCIPADHLDEIGQFLGQPPGPGNPFDYLDFYRGLASWLVARGF